jgi:hypothetical protein
LISRSASRIASEVRPFEGIELVGGLEHPVRGLRIRLDLRPPALEEMVDLAAARGRGRRLGLGPQLGEAHGARAQAVAHHLGDVELGVVRLERDLLDRADAVDVRDDELLAVGERVHVERADHLGHHPRVGHALPDELPLVVAPHPLHDDPRDVERERDHLLSGMSPSTNSKSPSVQRKTS